MTEEEHTRGGEEDKLDLESFGGRSQDDLEFTWGFRNLLERATEGGALTDEAAAAAEVLFSLLRHAILDGDSDALTVTASRLVQKDEEGEKVYSRLKGAFALRGWLVALARWVPEIRAGGQDAWLPAGFLVRDLRRYDDRALHGGDAPISWTVAGFDRTVLDVIDAELPNDAPITKAAIVSIAARLSTTCNAFDHRDYRTARSAFEKVAKELDP